GPCRARFDERRARARLVRDADDEPGVAIPGVDRQARRDDGLYADGARRAGRRLLGDAAQRAAGIAGPDRTPERAAPRARRVGLPAARRACRGDAIADLRGYQERQGGADLSRAVAAG